MIITLASVGGAPGVTSWTVMLAAAWPPESETERVVVEADLDGAVLGARFGIGVDPGTSTLVSASRRANERSLDLTEIGRLVDPLAWLVPGPETAEASRQLWDRSRRRRQRGRRRRRDHRVWLFDVGRAGPSTILGPLYERAAISLVVCRSEHDSLVQIPARIASMKKAKCFTGVVVVGKPAFGTAELHDFFGSDRIWVTGGNDDLVNVSRQVWGERRVKRSQHWRSAVTIATDIADALQARSMTPSLSDTEVADGR